MSVLAASWLRKSVSLGGTSAFFDGGCLCSSPGAAAAWGERRERRVLAVGGDAGSRRVVLAIETSVGAVFTVHVTTCIVDSASVALLSDLPREWERRSVLIVAHFASASEIYPLVATCALRVISSRLLPIVTGYTRRTAYMPWCLLCCRIFKHRVGSSGQASLATLPF